MKTVLTYKYSGCFKTLTILTIILLSLISQNSIAQSLPSFSEDFWQGEKTSASGKIKRGAGLTVLGAGTFVPAAILIKKSIDNPSRYTGWSAAISIAAIGMTAHGIGSILFGTK
ncbi:MAG: hypothetical protein JXR91_02725, partial [Deltaproteobacteria bacterium]|nr:hypothetical protein [Deltaproteobacteria bacterium]